jgi:HSP20 family protein
MLLTSQPKPYSFSFPVIILSYRKNSHFRRNVLEILEKENLTSWEVVIIFLPEIRRKEGKVMAWELTTWRPFREVAPFSDFERMRREMDRLWESFYEGGLRKRAGETGEWLPSLDVAETKNEIVVKAEVPGMDPKDIDISLSDGVLTIKGEKKQDREEKEEDYHLIERSYGTFTRSVQLPKGVQGNKVSASYKDGVLKVTLPKSEEAKKKEVKIKVE